MITELICVDIDGTLLKTNKELSDNNKTALKRAYDKGIKIALVSGRMPSGVSLIEEKLGFPCIKVCHAGTYIMDDDKCLSASYLSTEVLKKIYNMYSLKFNLPLWIFKDLKWYVTDIDEFIRKETVDIQTDPILKDVNDLYKEWENDNGPNKLLFAAKPEIIQTIIDDMKEKNIQEIDIARSADHFLEIFPKGINKGTALHRLCEIYSIDPQNTIAFGDHELDIPLIQEAGFGIAMGNSVEKLKEVADYITLTNEEDGVAYAVNKFCQ